MLFGTGGCCCATQLCCQSEIQAVAPLVLTCDLVQYTSGVRTVHQTYSVTMRWVSPTPSFLTTMGDTVYTGITSREPQEGIDVVGTSGVFISDESVTWYTDPSVGALASFWATNPELAFHEYPWGSPPLRPQRFVIGRFGNIGWIERQRNPYEPQYPSDCQATDTGGPSQEAECYNEIKYNLGAVGSDECKVAMVRTDTNWPNYFREVGFRGSDVEQHFSNYDITNFSYLSKVTKWLTFTCEPVYGFGVYPYYRFMEYDAGVPYALFYPSSTATIPVRLPVETGLYEYTLTES